MCQGAGSRVTGCLPRGRREPAGAGVTFTKNYFGQNLTRSTRASSSRREKKEGGRWAGGRAAESPLCGI